jgi:predicted P-loop ATPase
MSAEPVAAQEWLPEVGQRAVLPAPGNQLIAEPDGNWRCRLIRNQKGIPMACLQNALVALEHAPEWQRVLHFDESALHVVAKAPPPWDSRTTPFVWRDDDDVRAAAWMQQQGIMVSKEVAGQAAQTIARVSPSHPIREYLKELLWDKMPRINDWLTLYTGVDPSEYARAVGSKWLIGAVARIFQPGCKNDTCLVLEGPQGLLKSTALRTLAHPWFTDEIADLGTKDAALQVRGVWIIELAELEAMGRPEASRTKAFMSRSADRYRPPYGRHLIEVPRESVFAGTVNHDTYLKDETGGRRFWPVRCQNIRIDDLRRDRDQLWAEAVARFNAGDNWWIESAGLSATAVEEQQQRYDEDAWQPLIADWADGREYVTVEQILRNCFEKQPKDWSQGDKARIGRCLHGMGWSRKRGPKDEKGRREWTYVPGPNLRSNVLVDQ